MARVMVERVGNRIHVKTPFAYKDRCKRVIGARWSKEARAWTYPLDLETARRLRDEFGEELDIGPNLWAWGKEQRAKEDTATALIDVSKMDLTAAVDLERVPEVAPTMWAAMQNRPYQPVATKYMSLMQRCLNADQPGIGKTIETLGALIERGVTGPVLVLAPKTSALTVWPAEIERWLCDVPHTVTVMAGLTAAKRDKAWDEYQLNLNAQNPMMHFLIANADQAGIKKFTHCPAGTCDGDEDWCPNLDQHVNKSETRRPWMHSLEWSAIVADETHKWLINTRGRNASQVGYGFTKLRVVEGGPMYALSGTPLKGKKSNIFGTLNWLWPRTYTSKWTFIEAYWKVQKDEVYTKARGSQTVRTVTDDWADPKAREAFFRSMRTVMIRRTKDELRRINPAWMPPEKRYHDVYVPMEGSQATHYKQMEKDSRAIIDGQVLSATGILAEMTRLKQFASSDGTMVAGNFKPTLPSAKFNWLLQFLEERGIEPKGELSEDIHKVVVASQFTSLINMWAAELRNKGIDCSVITGETTDHKRNREMVEFQRNPNCRVMFINTNAGGVSITLDAADDVVIMDETWVPDEQEQVEDRAHRASNVEHQVDVWYVRTKGTIEEAIAKANETKAESNHIVLDAQRGLRFARERFGTTTKELNLSLED